MIRKLRTSNSIIPNLFTSMNMFCGFLSIINASQGKYIYAAWLIVIASIFDALDGMVARLTNSSSALGVELDSLSDVVSFGAAPSFLIYSTYLFQFDAAGIIISSFLMIAGGFRLARFNVQLVGFDKDSFMGLPIPMSALTISTFILTFYENKIGYHEPESLFIIPLIILLSVLMVSTIKYDTFPKFSLLTLVKKPLLIAFGLAAIILVIITTGEALLYMFVLYILFGIFRQVFRYFLKK